MIGGHCIKSWSKTQSIISLSSAEAELYANVKTSAEALGLAALLKDLGMKTMGIEIIGDASAALGIIKRQGLGKLRHIDTNYLWIQEKAAKKKINYGKIKGTETPADLFTKHLSREVLAKHMDTMNMEFKDGKSEVAIELNMISKASKKAKDLASSEGENLKIWSRQDLGSKTYRTTSTTGPEWKAVLWRITEDKEVGCILNVEKVSQLRSSEMHRPLEVGQRDTVTHLIYR